MNLIMKFYYCMNIAVFQNHAVYFMEISVKQA